MNLHILTSVHHSIDESSSAIKLAIGLVATIEALVLGLQISSVKGSFDIIDNDLIHNAANIICLDSVLSKYGPQTRELRGSTGERNSAKGSFDFSVPFGQDVSMIKIHQIEFLP
jgi:hypothetical protein